MQSASLVPMPRLRPWRRLAPLPAAAAFMVVALLVPQRIPRNADVLADEIAEDLIETVVALTQEELITSAEQEQLEEEIERIRSGARERVDASTWEAADAVRERVAARMSARQDAVKWAQESLARYAAAAGAGTSGNAGQAAAADLDEVAKAVEALAKNGMLAGAPEDLRRLAGGRGTFPTDPEALRRLMASLAEFLEARGTRLADLEVLDGQPGRFDPAEFPLAASVDGDGDPGAGAANRGRADAALTRGETTRPFDKFKAQALPPGQVRGPDDWAPVVSMPGAPVVAPERGADGAARAYATTPGQAAWRRTLAPRHQSAVRKYFEP
jgi:hypothetical protein